MSIIGTENSVHAAHAAFLMLLSRKDQIKDHQQINNYFPKQAVSAFVRVIKSESYSISHPHGMMLWHEATVPKWLT